MAADIFISHCTADKEQAEAIGEGITGATMVLLVHSEAANLSPMVRREIDAAAATHKIIVPVRIDTALPQQGMQFYLSSTHWFDAQPPLEPHLPRLVETVTRLLKPADGSAPAPSIPIFAPTQFPEFGGQPAIAVLPFRFSVPEDEPFTDGLTEELISAMSAWRLFPVIARNSVFAYRGREMDVRLIGREL